MPNFLTKTYVGLLIARVLFALFGTGYIHPDEHFQNGEITAGCILSFYTLRTWEWDPLFPVRSVLSPFLTTGLPFALLGLSSSNGGHPAAHPATLFRVERLVFVGLSCLLDFAVYAIIPKSFKRYHALILLASSHVLFTFQIRPFSNSVEATLLAVALVLFHNFMQGVSANNLKSKWHIHALAVLSVLGTFTRVSFIALVLPMALQIVSLFYEFQIPFTTLFPPLLTGIGTVLLSILFDTAFFRSSKVTAGPYSIYGSSPSISLNDVISALRHPSVTPLNFLSYNLSTANLAEHGLHPHWLHLVVNLPIVVGPGLMWYGFREGVGVLRVNTFGQKSVGIDSKKQGRKAKQRSKARSDRIDVIRVLNTTLVCMILTYLTLLSFQPHQEPRFLIPLLLPFVLLTANIRMKSKLFWTTWIISNVILVFFFGMLHQAGIIPSLLYLHDLATADMVQNKTVRIVYWNTYMPPRRFLGVPESEVKEERISLTDLAGAPTSELAKALVAISHFQPHPHSTLLESQHAKGQDSNQRVYLVTPLHGRSQLPCCFALRRSFFPHVDLDHLKESIEAGWEGLGLGLFELEGEGETKEIEGAQA